MVVLLNFFDLFYHLNYGLSFFKAMLLPFILKLPSEHSYFSRTGMKVLQSF